MSQNKSVTQHRLGIARKALKDIVEYHPDRWEDEYEELLHLRYLAEQALKDMKREVDKARKRRKEEERVYLERASEELKKELDNQ